MTTSFLNSNLNLDSWLFLDTIIANKISADLTWKQAARKLYLNPSVIMARQTRQQASDSHEERCSETWRAFTPRLANITYTQQQAPTIAETMIYFYRWRNNNMILNLITKRLTRNTEINDWNWNHNSCQLDSQNQSDCNYKLIQRDYAVTALQLSSNTATEMAHWPYDSTPTTKLCVQRNTNNTAQIYYDYWKLLQNDII